ncbi:MAG: extracellular solute-binding protein, partial [Geminicoccaceae bacterium]
WWNSGAQPVQAVGSGDAAMALGWNGRFQAGMDEGLPIAMAWGQSVPQVGFFMIVKGAPNRDAAVKFLRFISTPAAQSPGRADLPGVVTGADNARLDGGLRSCVVMVECLEAHGGIGSPATDKGCGSAGCRVPHGDGSFCGGITGGSSQGCGYDAALGQRVALSTYPQPPQRQQAI